MGKKLTIKITEAGKHYMKCHLVDNCKVSRPERVPEPLKLGQLSGAADPCNSKVVQKDGHHPLLVISLFVLITSLLLRIYYSMSATYSVAR